MPLSVVRGGDIGKYPYIKVGIFSDASSSPCNKVSAIDQPDRNSIKPDTVRVGGWCRALNFRIIPGLMYRN